MSDLHLRFKQYQKKVITKNQDEDYVNTVAVENLLVSLCVAFYVQLLLEHQDAIAPEKTDLLNELLELLEEVPNVESFIGKGVFPLVCIWLVGWMVCWFSYPRSKNLI